MKITPQQWIEVVKLVSTFIIIPMIAIFFGRERITNSKNIAPTNFMTELLNRNYVKPELNIILQELAHKLPEGVELKYLDANFPFFDGFPLLPHLSHNDGKKLDLSFIYEDKNGIIWFECGRGLSTYDGKKITIYKERNYNSKNEWKLNDSDLWFKGDETEGYTKLEGNSGVYQYDGQKLSYRTFPVTPKSGNNSTYSISTAFVKPKNGTVWFGSYGAVIGYNGSDFKIIDNEYLGFTEKTGSLHIRSIMEDSKGNLWIGNNGIGVLKYDGKETVNFTAEQKLKKENTKGNSLERVFSIGEDTAGNIWFGTVEFGVWRYDGNSVKNFTADDGLESKHIWIIYKSKQGELWVGGANPSGVYRFNGNSFERKY